MGLGIKQGETITVTVEGDDETARGIWPTRWVCRYYWWQSRKVRA